MISRGRFGSCLRCLSLSLAAVAISAGGLIWSLGSSVSEIEPLWIGLLAASSVLFALHLLSRLDRSAGPGWSET